MQEKCTEGCDTFNEKWRQLFRLNLEIIGEINNDGLETKVRP